MQTNLMQMEIACCFPQGTLTLQRAPRKVLRREDPGITSPPWTLHANAILSGQWKGGGDKETMKNTNLEINYCRRLLPVTVGSYPARTGSGCFAIGDASIAFCGGQASSGSAGCLSSLIEPLYALRFSEFLMTAAQRSETASCTIAQGVIATIVHLLVCILSSIQLYLTHTTPSITGGARNPAGVSVKSTAEPMPVLQPVQSQRMDCNSPFPAAASVQTASRGS